MKNVFVADSKQVGGGMLFQIAQAVRLAAEGFSPEFIIRSIDELDRHINSSYASKSAFLLGYLNLAPKVLSSAIDFLELSPPNTVIQGSVISGALLKNGR